MGLCEIPIRWGCFAITVIVLSILVTQGSAENLSLNEERCRDENFCRAYCLSLRNDTMSARCGSDISSCICITRDNRAVKVRFIEERNPVPPTTPTTPRPAVAANQGVQYVNAQPMPYSQDQYTGNHNSIAAGQQSPQPSPILLECDASEETTRTCHLFCTMEIRAWYGLCNTTSKACACFGVPLSVVQTEPIAAIFHSTAPIPPSTPRPKYPPRPSLQQQYQQQAPQQNWRPIQPSTQPQYYPINQSPSPTVLAPATHNNQLQEHGPVRSAASMFPNNANPSGPTSFSPTAVDSSSMHQSSESGSSSESKNPNVAVTSAVTEDAKEPAATRRRRSLNDTANKDKESSLIKGSDSNGNCSKFKCAIACKRNNYFAPDCEPKCVEDACMCECFPRL